MNTLYNRDFLKLLDFTKKELNCVIQLAKKLKTEKKNKNEKKYLQQKNIVLIFEKESTRTRCSAEVAAFDQGARITYINVKNTHMRYKESIADTAMSLESIYDGILFRGIEHKTIEELAKYSKIPVWNGLTKKYHPTQIVADLLTIEESIPSNFGLSNIKIAYVGDAGNNIVNSLIESSLIYNFNLRIVSPVIYLEKAKKFIFDLNVSNARKKNITFTDNIEYGVKKVDFLYTDVWLSMGESIINWKEKISFLKEYQVNDKLLKLTDNIHVKVLHCLPALHDEKTILYETLRLNSCFKNGLEITDEVFKRNQNTIFRQSENKLHTIKSILIHSLVDSI